MRRPGRPAGGTIRSEADQRPHISREAILEKATELAMTQPLAELSIVGLAREFGVTTTLIHYYVGSRDELVSGVVNRYFQARMEQIPPPSKSWRRDIEAHARAVFDVMRKYGGVLQYVMSHNRSRMFQQVEAGQVDYGMEYLNRVAGIFRSGGFAADQAAMAYHLLAQYIMTAAYADVRRQLPAEHGGYIRDRIAAASATQYPDAHFIARPFSEVDSRSAFELGLHILLDGLAAMRAGKLRLPGSAQMDAPGDAARKPVPVRPAKGSLQPRS